MSKIIVNNLSPDTGISTITVAGNVEATKFVGAVEGSTGTFSSNVTIDGNLGVAGTITYEDVARVDAVGLSTFREGFGVGPLAGIALTAYKDGSIRTTGIITALSFGSDTNSIFTTGGTERLRIASDGNVTIGNDGDSGSNPSAGYDELCIEGGNENIGMCFLSPAANNVTQQISFGDSNNNQVGRIIYNHASDYMALHANNTERLRVTSTGNLLIGATAVEDWDSSRSHHLQITGATYATAGMSILDTQNDDNPGEIVLGKSRGTGNTIVQSADDVGQMRWCANDGAGFHTIAHIRCSMDGTPGSNDLPSKLTFATCGDGGTSVQEAMRIDSNGYIHQDRMPVFHAQSSPSRDGSGYVHSFGNVHTNIGNHYNNGSGKFVAPVNGLYFFSFTVWCNDGNANDSTGTLATVSIRNSSDTYQRDAAAFNVMPGNSASSSLSASGSGVAYMAATDHARLKTQFSLRGSQPRNIFSGFLLHAT